MLGTPRRPPPRRARAARGVLSSYVGDAGHAPAPHSNGRRGWIPAPSSPRPPTFAGGTRSTASPTGSSAAARAPSTTSSCARPCGTRRCDRPPGRAARARLHDAPRHGLAKGRDGGGRCRRAAGRVRHCRGRGGPRRVRWTGCQGIGCGAAPGSRAGAPSPRRGRCRGARRVGKRVEGPPGCRARGPGKDEKVEVRARPARPILSLDQVVLCAVRGAHREAGLDERRTVGGLPRSSTTGPRHPAQTTRSCR